VDSVFLVLAELVFLILGGLAFLALGWGWVAFVSAEFTCLVNCDFKWAALFLWMRLR